MKNCLMILQKQLSEVCGFNTKNENNGYADIIEKEIDAIQIWSDNRDILYQISIMKFTEIITMIMIRNKDLLVYLERPLTE